MQVTERIEYEQCAAHAALALGATHRSDDQRQVFAAGEVEIAPAWLRKETTDERLGIESLADAKRLRAGGNLRGLISPGLALGAEFGWGFLDISFDPDDDGVFVHGIFGNIFLEASVGI